MEGYAERLCHGEIGAGLTIMMKIQQLRSVGFDGWISIEDGVDGIDQLKRSVSFCVTRSNSIGDGAGF